ncbi:hypothetical protein LXA43DRAFT_1079581 [Ganoderma leucocontextum]|nr:hypothetical protein LXA43DRAFT_1079581 [Ganoderma leucocontextum]
MYDYSSDSDLEDEEDVEGEESSTRDVGAGDHTVKNDEGISTIAKEDEPEDASGLGLVHGCGQNQIHGRPGRVVFLGDVAYRTWKAFILYAYYDDLNFSPLKYQQKPRSKEQDPYKAPLCSPKSMYRIAHKYDIASLKEKASNDIKSKLSPSNILEEIFSTFTASLYPDIQAIELNYLFDIIKDAGVQARLPTWLEGMEERRLPKGAAGIVASLIAKLSIPLPAAAPAPLESSMKKCPRGCSTSYYRCNNCGSNF